MKMSKKYTMDPIKLQKQLMTLEEEEEEIKRLAAEKERKLQVASRARIHTVTFA